MDSVEQRRSDITPAVNRDGRRSTIFVSPPLVTSCLPCSLESERGGHALEFDARALGRHDFGRIARQSGHQRVASRCRGNLCHPPVGLVPIDDELMVVEAHDPLQFGRAERRNPRKRRRHPRPGFRAVPPLPVLQGFSRGETVNAFPSGPWRRVLAMAQRFGSRAPNLGESCAPDNLQSARHGLAIFFQNGHRRADEVAE